MSGTPPETLTTTTLAEGFVFLEAPRWREGRLWLSDMRGHKVFTLGLDGAREQVAEFPQQPSGIGFLPDGTPLVVSMRDRRVMRLEKGGAVPHADLSHLVDAPLNDMVVTPQGGAYVGNFGFDHDGGGKFRTTNLIFVSPEGEPRPVAEGLAFPNGCLITGGGTVLVVAETFAAKLTAFDIGPQGGLANPRVFAGIPGATPDGICLDLQGAVWVGSYARDEFLRVREGGEITHRIPVAGRRAVACQLGGPDGRTLFCLTAEGSREDIRAGRGHARVETVTVAVPGAGSP